MSYKYFGTDGVRGRAGQGVITPEFFIQMAQAAGHYLHAEKQNTRPTVVIGKDTRLSGYMLEAALQAGFTSVGWMVLLVGPMPTPAVAMLTRSLRADLGVMLTASHNPYHDNGIKLFNAKGCKLDPEQIHGIEALIDSSDDICHVSNQHIGRALRIEDAAGRYMESCKRVVPRSFSLAGKKIVVDCAHGASYKMAPKIMWELGAEVIRIGCEPNGLNINHHYGATDPANLQQAVRDHQADIGFAMDGDADRLITCDENGEIIDGDQVLGAMAMYLNSQNKLKGNGLVGTVMTNMGLEAYLKSNGLNLERTPVGDHYVAMRMKEKGYNLGGEPNGHLIFGDHAPLGDGILAALQVLATLDDTQAPASSLRTHYDSTVQLMENIRLEGVEDRQSLLENSSVEKAIAKAEADLGAQGRTVVRPSGTEPIIRVMAEGETDEAVRKAVKHIASAIEDIAGIAESAA
jgi:phosphoglucosamine mutase